MRLTRHSVSRIAIVLIVASAPRAAAQTWTGVSDGTNWNNAANWNPMVVPNSTTAVVTFTNQVAGPVNIATSVAAQSIAFTNTAGLYTITSSNLQKLTDLSTITVASGVTALQTINLDNNSHGSLLFDNTLSIVNNASAAVGTTLLIGPSTVIGTTGLGGLAVSGTGTTQISGTFASFTSNQVIGGITMAGPGQLQLTGDNSALLATNPGGNIVVLNGGTLAINNDDTLGATTFGLELNTNSSTTGGLVFLNAGVTVTHAVDLNSTTRIVSNGTDTNGIYSVISGGGQLVKDGAGELTFANAGNAYSGGTLIVSGTLAAAADGAFGAPTGGLTIGGGALEATATFLSARGITVNTAGGTISVDSGATLTLSGGLGGPGSLNKIGPGTLILSADNSSYAGGVTISAGTITPGSQNALAGSLVTVTANGTLSLTNMQSATLGNLAGAGSITLGGATLTVGGNNTSPTFSGTITDAAGGPGTVVKTGLGILTLTGTLTNTGAYSVTGGALDFSGALVQPGTGTIAAAARTTVEYTNGTRVFGGFIAGPGTQVVSGGSLLSGLTTTVSAFVNQTGPATFTNVTNGGALNLSSGATLAGFTNQGSGAITVTAAGSDTLSDFQSYGTLALAPGASSNAATILTNVGATPLYFNGGSRTFLGTAATAVMNGQPTFLAGIDLHGNNAVVAGGLFVNNGFVVDSNNGGMGTATVVADFGSLVEGAGFFQNTVITQNGGKFKAGNCPGQSSFGNFVMGPGGVNNDIFYINNATGTAGPSPDAAGYVSGWSLIKSVKQAVGTTTTPGNFTWTATPADPLMVALDTLVNPTIVGTDDSGPMADFDPTKAYSWLAAQWTGTYSGPTDAATLNADTAFDTSGFVNQINGTFGWSLDSADQTLSLTYTPTPVPEPGTLAFVGLAAVGLARWRRRTISPRYCLTAAPWPA